MTKHRALMLGVLILLVGTTVRTEQAGAGIAGTYANLSCNGDGMGGQNRLTPRLELDADNTYARAGNPELTNTATEKFTCPVRMPTGVRAEWTRTTKSGLSSLRRGNTTR